QQTIVLYNQQNEDLVTTINKICWIIKFHAPSQFKQLDSLIKVSKIDQINPNQDYQFQINKMNNNQIYSIQSVKAKLIDHTKQNQQNYQSSPPN
ncbi:hypothetical protein pb186bvf_012633, partial [Paramecium bursaria]